MSQWPDVWTYNHMRAPTHVMKGNDRVWLQITSGSNLGEADATPLCQLHPRSTYLTHPETTPWYIFSTRHCPSTNGKCVNGLPAWCWCSPLTSQVPLGHTVTDMGPEVCQLCCLFDLILSVVSIIQLLLAMCTAFMLLLWCNSRDARRMNRKPRTLLCFAVWSLHTRRTCS